MPGVRGLLEDVAALALELPSRPRVIALTRRRWVESLGDVRTLAEATDRREEGVELVAGRRRASTA